MGHYDNCRDGYCSGCAAAPGNIKESVCEFCHPSSAGAPDTRSTLDQQIKDAGVRVAKAALANPGVYPAWGHLQGAKEALRKAHEELVAAQQAWEHLIRGAKTKECDKCLGTGKSVLSGSARPRDCVWCSGTGRLFDGPKD